LKLKYYTADVFTDEPFGGNQLAVFPDARGLDGPRMLNIAREFNFSETTFVFPPEDKKHTRRVRIFTPRAEIPFAGHPTVGTAVIPSSQSTGCAPADTGSATAAASAAAHARRTRLWVI
jgi:trans-2,3-dihydro-3-hydroxyanthranilate isomerase